MTCLRFSLARPDLFYDLPPRRFEEIVAELYSRRGFDVTLTPATGDRGVDVVVVRHDELGWALSVVQCKRYTPRHKIGVNLVRELQGTIQQTGATSGAIVTTSFFTAGARKLEDEYKYQLSLKDYFGLQQLLKLPRRAKP
jgi:restriction system protein